MPSYIELALHRLMINPIRKPGDTIFVLSALDWTFGMAISSMVTNQPQFAPFRPTFPVCAQIGHAGMLEYE